MEEKLVNIYISSDQHEARFRKLEKVMRRENRCIVQLAFCFISLILVAVYQMKRIDEQKEEIACLIKHNQEKEDERTD